MRDWIHVIDHCRGIALVLEKGRVKDRPGHDRRYAIDATKIKNQLDRALSVPFAEGMKQTAEWYLQDRWWWQRIKTGEYLKYCQEWYGKR